MSKSAQLKRPMNPDKGQVVTIELNRQQVELVNRFYATGMYGNTPAQVVRWLFCEGCLKHSQPTEK